MSIEEILIVKHNNNLYGINTENVEHILRVVDMTPVPLAPNAVIGLCAIEGSIVNVLDFSQLLQETNKIDVDDPKSRLITVHSNEMMYSILTQEVVNNVTVQQNDIEYIAPEQQREDGVIALYKYEKSILQVLSVEMLVSRIKLDTFLVKNIKNKVETSSKTDALVSKHRRYLLFDMGNETYGLEVSKIREVINLPKTFTEITESAPEVIGMMTLRDELVLVSDLRKIFDIDSIHNEKSRIVIIQSNNQIMGVVVDEIVDIIDFPVDDIDHMPSNFKDDKIVGIANVNDELVSLINVKVIDAVMDAEIRLSTNALDQSKDFSDEEKTEIITFMLANNAYAFKAEEVVEIIDSFEITDIPDMPEMVEGVTNIRGSVIPIVKLYEKLDLVEQNSAHKKLIVCQLNNSPIGIVVDVVSNVKNMEQRFFIPEEESPYFTHVIKEDKGVVLMIDLIEVFKTLNKEA